MCYIEYQTELDTNSVSAGINKQGRQIAYLRELQLQDNDAALYGQKHQYLLRI